MKLGLLTAALPELSLEALAKWASESGFEMLEVACWPPGKAERRYAGVTHIDAGALDAKKAAQIKNMLDAYRLKISSLAYYPNPLTADLQERKKALDHLKKVIVAAQMLDVPMVGTFVGRDKDKNVEDNFAEFEKVWPPIVAFAKQHQVKVAIENCPMIFSDDEWPGGNNLAISPRIWKRMYEIIPDKNFGLNLDPSHLVFQMIDAERVIYEFAERIFHVHAKDLMIDWEGLYENGTLSQGMGWQIPRLPGLGDVNWSKFFRALYRVGYDYVVSIEHEDRAFEQNLELVQRGFYLARDVLKPYIC